MTMRPGLAATVVLLAAGGMAPAGAGEPGTVVENPTRLQVAYDVDVLVAGGSLAGVEAACAAARAGADVLLIEARPYLGYDLCATQRLWLEEGERPVTPLTRSIFGQEAVATPMRVKGNLDRALLEAGARFLTGCFAVDALFAAGDGAPAGVAMVNRSGRQAIRAKVIIDATYLAAVTRCTDAGFRPFTAGPKDLKYVMPCSSWCLSQAVKLRGVMADRTGGCGGHLMGGRPCPP
ncbi:MAG: FAD-dependent oxidoreductase, partial [Planctomycetota bacterium]